MAYVTWEGMVASPLRIPLVSSVTSEEHAVLSNRIPIMGTVNHALFHKKPLALDALDSLSVSIRQLKDSPCEFSSSKLISHEPSPHVRHLKKQTPPATAPSLAAMYDA